MSQPHNILEAHRPVSMRERVSEEEWAARVELAALYRIVHHFGMTDLIANHITMRVPDGSGHILINAYGLTYDEVTASNLYKITTDRLYHSWRDPCGARGCACRDPHAQRGRNRRVGNEVWAAATIAACCAGRTSVGLPRL